MSLADLLVMRPEFRRRPLDTAELDAAVARIREAFPDGAGRSLKDLDSMIERIANALKPKGREGVRHE